MNEGWISITSVSIRERNCSFSLVFMHSSNHSYLFHSSIPHSIRLEFEVILGGAIPPTTLSHAVTPVEMPVKSCSRVRSVWQPWFRHLAAIPWKSDEKKINSTLPIKNTVRTSTERKINLVATEECVFIYRLPHKANGSSYNLFSSAMLFLCENTLKCSLA